MTKRVLPASMMAGVVLSALVLTGCSDGAGAEKETTVSKSLQVCEQYLGEKNLEGAIDSISSGEKRVSATESSAYLVERLAREAEEWSKGELLHNQYTVCRIDFPMEDGTAVIEAMARWSVLTLDMLSEPKYVKSWKQLNDQVFVEPETGQSGMRLLVPCGVRGAPAGQQADAPLQLDVADPGLTAEQRQALLSTLARTLVDELACTNDPAVPAKLIP
ncbi:hypothetical protein AB0D13_01540 [Streptomyces sp. NPDC048430]|uniref:hypothetical protein n=1 Tax=Streptomyces sp. NPDC048430 TaxID=3155388 RepID=UPI00342232CF